MTRDEAIKYAKENILAYTSEMAEFKALAIEALGNQMKPKWNKTSEVKPTEEKQYLCCSVYTKPYFKVLWWSNNLYEVDEYDFYDRKGKSGFYELDPEYGHYIGFCDYWQEIEWGDEE